MKSYSLLLLTLLVGTSASAKELFVSVDGTNPTAPYANWDTAATIIQDAVDLAEDGDTVYVADGIYAQGGMRAPGLTLTNRVCVTDVITIQSVNGPEHTTIVGKESSTPGNRNGPDAMRGVYLADGATLSGFTITGGHTIAYYAGSPIHDRNGGGVAGEVYGGMSVITNCFITGNSGDTSGGAYYAVLNNCRVYDNSSVGSGGGANTCTLNHCVIEDNSANNGGGMNSCIANACLVTNNQAWYWGGGAQYGTLNNCLVIGNSAAREGGGAYKADAYNSTITQNTSVYKSCGGIYDGYTIKNCIIFGNTAFEGAQDFAIIRYFQHNCTPSTLSTSAYIYGNIGADPLFVNAAAGDFRLQTNSPCIGAGNNASIPPGNDYQGAPRALGGTVDMGCYEYFVAADDSDSDSIPNQWEVEHGLNMTNGLDAVVDSDNDNISNLDEYIADTHPLNPDSNFHTTADTDAGNWICRLNSSPDRIYTLLFSDSLTNGTWNPIPSIPQRAGTGTDDSFTVSTNLNAGFIKLTVELP